MVYVTALLLVIAGSVFYVFDGYQVSNEKTRLQGTTDAAAYSVAAIEATSQTRARAVSVSVFPEDPVGSVQRGPPAHGNIQSAHHESKHLL